MKCPFCKNKMIDGRFQIGATVLGFLFFGFSYKHLFFYSSMGNERMKAMDNSEVSYGFYCEKCNSFSVDNFKASDNQLKRNIKGRYKFVKQIRKEEDNNKIVT